MQNKFFFLGILFLLGAYTFLPISYAQQYNNIQSVLNFPEQVELDRLDQITLIERKFINPYTQKQFDSFMLMNYRLKAYLFSSYSKGDINYYTMNGILNRYESFIWQSNQYYYYKKRQERQKSFSEIESIILSYERKMRSSFIQLKQLLVK